MNFKEYKTTAVTVIAVIVLILVFGLVFNFINWITHNIPLAQNLALISCVLVLIAIVADLSRKPKPELTNDLAPKGASHTAIPDEDALKDIPVAQRLDYSTAKKESFYNSENETKMQEEKPLPTFGDGFDRIEEYERQNNLNQ